ncbi:MAG TPA: hypothetical protein VHB02_08525 [Acidimicrobiales bacterium]|nr:hypothetical protein [Acidimicrobiales bacterium]
MRLGVVLDGPAGPDLVAEAAAADRVGLDLVWVAATDRDGARRDATVVAAALTRVVRDAAVVVEAHPHQHPLELAEKLAVTDLLLAGRLTVAFTGPAGSAGPGAGSTVEPGPGAVGEAADDGVAEGIEVTLAGLSPLPFRHAGPHWTFPAPGSPDLLRVTPAPAQLAMDAWAVGAGLAEVAGRHGLALVAADGEPLPPAGPARWPRIALRSFDVPADPGPAGTAATAEVVAALAAERDRAGLGICAVRLPAADPGRRLGAVEVLGARVRPQLLLPRPDGDLVDSWSLPASAHLEDQP